MAHKQPFLEEFRPLSTQISPATFDRLAAFVTSETGIKMPENKLTMLQSRLIRRVRALGLQSIEEYCQVVFSSADASGERVHLIDAITTNKTDFFREPAHFDVLTRVVLPSLKRRSSGTASGAYSFWSAPCSSGEEPYTLAMVLSEYAAAHPGFDFQILGTDVSTRVLETAKTAIYTRQQIAPVPAALRRRYLLAGKGEKSSLVRVAPALRRRTSFQLLNFMDREYRVGSAFDVIFCRNVLIYFDRATQEAVINKLCANLSPDGYLFVSMSESLNGLDVPLLSQGGSCFRKV